MMDLTARELSISTSDQLMESWRNIHRFVLCKLCYFIPAHSLCYALYLVSK